MFVSFMHPLNYISVFHFSLTSVRIMSRWMSKCGDSHQLQENENLLRNLHRYFIRLTEFPFCLLQRKCFFVTKISCFYEYLIEFLMYVFPRQSHSIFSNCYELDVNMHHFTFGSPKQLTYIQFNFVRFQCHVRLSDVKCVATIYKIYVNLESQSVCLLRPIRRPYSVRCW